MRNKILIITSVIGILILSGCINEETKPGSTTTNPGNLTGVFEKERANESNNNSQPVTIYPITITDNLGRTVTIAQEPQRIISLSPAHTEILFALGLGNKIVGVTNYCNYPEDATTKPIVSQFSEVNIEMVVNSSPDLVLMTSGVQSYNQLDNLGITLLAFDANTVSDVLENIKLIGMATNRENEAKKLTESMQERIDAVKITADNRASKPKVFYIIWNDPLWTIGPDAFINDAIDVAGGNNIFSYDLPAGAPKDYFTTNLEAVIARNPNIIIIDSHSNSAMNTTQWIKNNNLWQGIDAVQNNRIYVMDADIASRAGPRVVDALEQYSGWFENWE